MYFLYIIFIRMCILWDFDELLLLNPISLPL
nr:MAG TPA: hypothetical protein [Caudoviricetes sp.]